MLKNDIYKKNLIHRILIHNFFEDQNIFLNLVVNVLIQLFVVPIIWAASLDKCSEIFNPTMVNDKAPQFILSGVIQKTFNAITAEELIEYTIEGIEKVPEFQFIRETAVKMGLRVWLFGGTASSFLHYVKWDLARSRGQMDLQKDRFDYDYTNIFRSTQDLDIVIDANPEVAENFQKIIADKYPHFLGAKAKWEVRTLRSRMGKVGDIGFKEALLDDPDFNNQNTDSNSLGMVELTSNKNLSRDFVIQDLKNWNHKTGVFLADTLNNRISFFRSKNHFLTSRAKSGENPEILSVIRILVKAFQYELELAPSDFAQMKQIVDEFDDSILINNNALRRIHDTAKKLVMHATNIEYALNTLEELGLRQKLIKMGNVQAMDTDAWWLNREPLRTRPLGTGKGLTAVELQIKLVAHETNNFLAYESITRSHSGQPNVFISREQAVGEAAVFGAGFYTKMGREGARGTGLTIRFIVNPNAREGSDFIIAGNFIIFKNKKALTVIQESLNLGIDDLLVLAETNQELKIDHSDFALLEKVKRKLNATIINNELNKLLNSSLESDHDRLIYILNSFQNSNISKLISEDILNSVVKNIFNRVSSLTRSLIEADIVRYIKTIAPILKILDSTETLKTQSFFDYLDQLIKSPSVSFSIKRVALFELLLSSENIELHLNFKEGFKVAELKELTDEIRDWGESPDTRKRGFNLKLLNTLSQVIEDGRIEVLESFINAKLFDVNFKNKSQVSILQLAAYFNQMKIIVWLIANPQFDFNAKSSLGYTEVEQLRLSGKSEFADVIEQNRPDVQSRKIKVRERNIDYRNAEYFNGTPIIDFVRFEPGSFMMGRGLDKILTTITDPFELMSVDITQKTYSVVVNLIKNYLSVRFKVLIATPSKFRADNHPVEQVNFDDISLWIEGLNELSKMNDSLVQKTLATLFPNHKYSDKYILPSEKQWEYASRLGGVAEGDYSHGQFNESNLKNYSNFHLNFGSGSSPVGLKKPVYYNGKPIYDLHGNIWKFLKDNWFGVDKSLNSSNSPYGLSHYVIRGGSWRSNSEELNSGNSYGYSHFVKNNEVGFRLVRIISQ
jgi:formylglycine-generating enzyme required for sulfatase activity